MAKRIVIIEDDNNILEVLVYLFENEGYHVSPFTKIREVGEIVSRSPDVVLLDINLSGSTMRGDEICADIKKLPADKTFPVVLLSAETDLNTLARNCMADGYVTKPFDINKLILKIESVQA